jgi:hypothetical protein
MWPGSILYKNAIKSGKIKDPAKFMLNPRGIINISRMTSDEFDQIYDKVLTRKDPSEFQNISITRDYEKKQTYVSGTCPGCASSIKNQLLHENFSTIECPVCRATYFVNSNCVDKEIDYTHVRRNLDFLIEKYGDIAFRGIGNFFEQYLFKQLGDELAKNTHIHFIDQSSGRQYGGKVVEDISVLDKGEIKCVVVSVALYTETFDAIIAEQLEKYPNIHIEIQDNILLSNLLEA